MTEDDIAWLIEEIDESLDAGVVGLYEFVWTLHGGPYPDVPAKDLLHICRPVLDKFLAEPGVTLAWYDWPPREPVRPATEADLDDHSFDDIGDDGRYLAIDRT